MLWLPPIEYEDRHWHLPLSEGAAAFLVRRRLLSVSPTGFPWTRKQLTRLLLVDPAFCLWCLWHHHLQAPGTARLTIGSLAKWLRATGTPNWLPSSSRREWNSPTRGIGRQRCRQLSARAVLAATSARPRSWARQPDALADQLRGAARWFFPHEERLAELPIPPVIRQQIAGRRARQARGPLRRKYRRWIAGTWSRPANSFRDLLAATLTDPESRQPQFVIPDPEKLAALQQLAYGASHEINNTLANISTRAQLLMRLTDDPVILKHAAAINQQTFRAHEMIADLMLFAKPPQLQYTIFDLADLVREVTRQTAQEIAEQTKHIELRERIHSALIQADAAQLSVALKAILRNAVEAIQDEGIVWIKLTSTAGRRAPKRIKLRIRDNGPGLSREDRQHLFDPFYSGRESGRGLGFGLTKAWTILRLHQGDISARLPAGGGVEFQIHLPCD